MFASTAENPPHLEISALSAHHRDSGARHEPDHSFRTKPSGRYLNIPLKRNRV